MEELMYNTVPYVVKKGDNLSKIARQNNRSVQELIRVNPEIRNPELIFPGQEIRLPIPGGIQPMRPFDPSAMMGQMQVPPPRDNPMSHPMGQPDPEQIMRQLGMGAMAGAAPMAAMAGPGAVMGGLGAMARAMPRMNPAGQVAQPMFKGAVPHPGATRAMSNVRPYPDVGGMPASQAAAQGALNQAARMRRMEPRGMDRVPFDPMSRM